MKNLTEVLKHPATTLFVGDTGEGKTAGAAASADWYKEKDVQVYMMDKPKAFPKWIKNLPSNNIDLKDANSVLWIDDAHNYFYAGLEEDREDLKAIDLISRARRHGGKRSVIYTTQQTSVLSRKLIGMTTVIIFKKSSPMQIQFERPEFQKLFLEANEALKDQPIEIGYAISADYRGLIEIEMPDWYTKEISEIAEPGQRGKIDKGGLLNGVIDTVKMIGRLA